jgi:hypothetical protein
LLAAGVIVYFYWENIANWWDGPVEEDGETEGDE